MSTNGNGKIIAIVVSVVIATSGISFGVIQGSARADITEFRERLDRHEETINELRIQRESERKDIEYIKRDLEEMKSDLKEIVELLRD